MLITSKKYTKLNIYIYWHLSMSSTSSPSQKELKGTLSQGFNDDDDDYYTIGRLENPNHSTKHVRKVISRYQ